MKFLLKILAAPVVAALSAFIFLATKLVEISAIVLNFLAVLVALGSISHIVDGRTGNGIAGLLAAFLLTPYGLPLITILLLGEVQRFKCWIRDRVY